MTEAYRQGYDHGYENAKEDVLLQLMDDLNIAEECEKCPRWDGRCKGHLSWLCRKIREAMDDEA